MAKENKGLTAVIFSKDRPAQLECLLDSIQNYTDIDDITILYTSTTPRHDEAYRDVFDIYTTIPIKEKNFQEDFEDIIYSADDYVMLLCDDDVFIGAFMWGISGPAIAFRTRTNVLTLSTRLHPGIRYCHAYKSDVMVPKIVGDSFVWRNGQGDWGYPVSLDGNIYKKEVLQELVKDIKYKNPNQLEGMMNGREIRDRYIVCVRYPTLIGVPLNRVQDEVLNENLGLCPNDLTEQYLSGYRLRYDPEKFSYLACHEMLSPELKKIN